MSWMFLLCNPKAHSELHHQSLHARSLLSSEGHQTPYNRSLVDLGSCCKCRVVNLERSRTLMEYFWYKTIHEVRSNKRFHFSPGWREDASLLLALCHLSLSPTQLVASSFSSCIYLYSYHLNWTWNFLDLPTYRSRTLFYLHGFTHVIHTNK